MEGEESGDDDGDTFDSITGRLCLMSMNGIAFHDIISCVSGMHC